MSETKNYKLHLTDDSSERFLDWRNQMNGTDDSNMMKIDAALGEKANSSIFLPCTLLAEAWEDGKQTISIEGLGAEQNGVIGITQDISEVQLKAVYAAGLYVSGQADGTLTVALKGATPKVDIPAIIILLG